MGTIHALQRRVEVAQQGLTLFEDEARGAGARLSDAFGRIEEVLRDKDFQLVRRELEVQRLTRENAQARMLLETLLETVEQRKLPALREVIEEFERKLAASAALQDASDPAAGEPENEAQTSAAETATAEPAPENAATVQPSAPEPAEIAPSPGPAILAFPTALAASAPPLAAYADPGGDDVTVAMSVAVAEPAEREEPVERQEESLDPEEVEEPAAVVLPPVPAAARAEVALDPNEELIADARAQLRSRKGGAARLLEEEERRYSYKVWLGPIMIGVGALGPLALVLARLAH